MTTHAAAGAHTPGPWSIDAGPVTRQICVGSGDMWICGQIHNANGMSLTEAMANARLIAAAPTMLAALNQGASKNLPDFLDWLADRLVHVYGESPNVDFVLSTRERARLTRAAIAKAVGASTEDAP